MKKEFHEAQDFLNTLYGELGFDLRASADENENGCLLDISGEDASLLRSEGGELLDAFEHLVNQAFGRHLQQGQRFICDVNSFRLVRETELRAMARHAAQRVRASGVPFTFGPMNANERRVIHLELANEGDLYTESVGEGNGRRLKVSSKASSNQ